MVTEIGRKDYLTKWTKDHISSEARNLPVASVQIRDARMQTGEIGQLGDTIIVVGFDFLRQVGTFAVPWAEEEAIVARYHVHLPHILRPVHVRSPVPAADEEWALIACVWAVEKRQ